MVELTATVSNLEAQLSSCSWWSRYFRSMNNGYVVGNPMLEWDVIGPNGGGRGGPFPQTCEPASTRCLPSMLLVLLLLPPHRCCNPVVRVAPCMIWVRGAVADHWNYLRGSLDEMFGAFGTQVRFVRRGVFVSWAGRFCQLGICDHNACDRARAMYLPPACLPAHHARFARPAHGT
jgi:hypothetical protein